MRVLIIEDDALLASGLDTALSAGGCVVTVVPSAESADRELCRGDADLIVLDIELPGIDGLTWLQRMRAKGRCEAVLVLTARAAIADRVRGLEFGADDYMTKPFVMTEFMARIHALARRQHAMRSHRIDHGPLSIDLDRERVALDGKTLELRSREYAILEFLFCNVDAVLSKDRIAAAVARHEGLSGAAIEVHISRLRARLEPAGLRIRSIRGLGYLVEPWKDQ
jgi:DNA-binding response OmpR family regulator